MERLEIEIVEVELKYCERCGGLWLRPCGSQRVYCGICAPRMAALELPEEPPEHFALPVPVEDDGELEAGIEHLAFLCGEGGNA